LDNPLGSTNFAQRNHGAVIPVLHKIRQKNDKRRRVRTALVVILHAIGNYSRRTFIVKKLLNLILGIAVLATLGGLATAKAASSVKSSMSNTSDRAAVDKASPKLITGKVSQVDPKTRTFTLKAKGKEYKFLFPKGGAQPKVGDIVEVTYTGVLGGVEPAQSINLNSSRSNIY
jgi:hypothetical protein